MRMSDWSSDVCSSDLLPSVENRTSPTSWFCTISSVVNGFDAVAVRGDTAARTESRKTTTRSPRGSLMLHMPDVDRSEEHTSELQSLMRISYAVFCLKKKKQNNNNNTRIHKHTTTKK